jgi:LmbE family N-acetylglucosaminyl deacetylase
MADDLVMVFSPHPDDDVIACGGTIRARVLAGARVVIVYSTDGSMSHAAVLGIHRDPSPRELIEVRQAEAAAAAGVLGVAAANLHFLGFPDTRLAGCLPEFAAMLRKVLEAHPGAGELYLPHEVRELNADHQATGETVLKCVRELGLTPRIRKFVVWDQRTEDEFAFVNRRRAPASASGGGLDGGPGGERLVQVDIAADLGLKRAAMAEHRTQVTLYSPAQSRPVVPREFQARVLSRTVEEFWT